MSDEEMVENFRLLRSLSKARRATNRDRSAQMLRDMQIPFVSKNDGAHLIVADRFDFWPGTGKWKDRRGGEYRRGVKSLIGAWRATGAQPPRSSTDG